jgi:hypothetical protein
VNSYDEPAPGFAEAGAEWLQRQPDEGDNFDPHAQPLGRSCAEVVVLLAVIAVGLFALA